MSLKIRETEILARTASVLDLIEPYVVCACRDSLKLDGRQLSESIWRELEGIMSRMQAMGSKDLSLILSIDLSTVDKCYCFSNFDFFYYKMGMRSI
jgi:hypothetical protein